MVEDVEFVIAGYDYEARESHELSIRKGERLRLISDLHNWWKVVNDRGQIGFVPSNFVTRKPQSLANRAKETFRALGRSKSKNSLDIEPLQQEFSNLNTTADTQLPSLPTSILKKAKTGSGIKLSSNEMPESILYAIAKFNYDPQREDELRLVKGDQLNILDKSADGWWRVSSSDGASGWIPSNYVDETNSAPAEIPTQAFSSSNGSNNQQPHSYNYDGGMANLPTHHTSFSNAPVSGRVLEVVVALYSFDAQNAEELSFKKGEQLDVIDHPSHDPDWYKAKNSRGDIGLIPTNYIEIVDRASTTFSNTPGLTGPYAGEPWYFGPLSREQSDGLLNSQGIEGDFLIRDSESNPGDYSISLKGNLRNKHFWVQVTTNGEYKIGNRTFTSMQQLIQHYTKSPIFSNDSTNERLYLVRPLPR